MTYDANRIEQAYQLFFDAVTHENGLKKLAQAAYQLLGYPIIINDAFGCSIIQYPEYPICNKDFDFLLEHKISNFEHHHAFWERYVTQDRTYPIFIRDGHLEKADQLFSVLKKGTTIIGFTSFMNVDKQKMDEESEIVRLFNLAASHSLSILANTVTENLNWHSTIFRQILQSDHESEDYLEKARNLSNIYKPNYAVFVVKPNHASKYDFFFRFQETICVQIKKRFPNYLYAILDEQIVFLGNSLKLRGSSVLCSEFLEFLTQFPTLISISLPFTDLSAIDSYYLQAQLTMQIGLQTDADSTNIYRAENYTPLQIFTDFSNHNLSAPFIHPILLEIQAYDQIHRTEYLHTLRIYLFCMKDKQEAADRLHIHINSLSYRVKQLQNIFHIDFSNYFLLNSLVAGFGLIIASGSHYPEYMADVNPDAIKD